MLLVVGLFALFINTVNPQVINSSDDTITISATASGLQSGVTQYLQTAITRDGDATNYLGLTKNLNDEWFQYKSTPSTSDLSTYFYSFTPVVGSWSGQLVAKIDTTDDGFKGPGSYLLKLVKYISSSGSYSNNSVAITVNIPLPSTVSAQTQTTQTDGTSPSFEIDTPERCVLGEFFKISSRLKNFNKETEYYLKLRGGPDENHVTKMQTKNGDSYFSDNEGWENFPVIKTDSSGNWSGDIWGLLGEDKDEGIYKIKLRVRKKETDTFSESEFKDLKFSKPVIVIVPVATKSSIVATPTAQIKTKEPEILGAATEIATPAPVKTLVFPKKDFSPLAILGGGLIFVAIIMAAFLHKDRLWDIIRRCKISWPHFS